MRELDIRWWGDHGTLVQREVLLEWIGRKMAAWRDTRIEPTRAGCIGANPRVALGGFIPTGGCGVTEAGLTCIPQSEGGSVEVVEVSDVWKGPPPAKG